MFSVTVYRVVFNEVVQTTKDFMRDVTVINPDWLCELAPDFYQFGTVSHQGTTFLKLFLWAVVKRRFNNLNYLNC